MHIKHKHNAMIAQIAPRLGTIVVIVTAYSCNGEIPSRRVTWYKCLLLLFIKVLGYPIFLKIHDKVAVI